MPERFSPEDPREWLNRAESNIALARTRGTGIYLEDLCFHAQQAAEKAIKALLIHRRVDFPYVHDIAELLTLLEQQGFEVPEAAKEAEKLTRFAVFTRYPGIATPVTEEEYKEAVDMAEKIVNWVREEIGK